MVVGVPRRDLRKWYHWPRAPEANRGRPGKSRRHALAKAEQPIFSWGWRPSAVDRGQA